MTKKDKKSQEKKEKIKLKKEKQKLKSVKKKKKKNGTISDEDFDTICMYYEILNKKDKYGHININTTSNNTFAECEKPGPRGNFSLTFINDEEFLLFGGEYNDNNNLVVYNDLFKYNVTKNVWKYYFTTSKKPKPRCAHQAVHFNKKLYIFGGELCTNSQFFHYNDFWSFDLKSNTFEEIETKNKKDEKPSPRSGHRMILWKNCLVMFGGFFDNGKSVDYFNDLYLYIISSNKWINLTNVYMDSLFRSFTQNLLSTTSNNTQTLGDVSFGKNKKGNKSNSKNNVSPQESNSIAVKSKFLKNIGIDSYIPSKRSSVALFTDAKHEQIFIYGGYCPLKGSLKSGTGKYYNDIWVVQVNISNEYNPMVNFKKIKRSVFHPCDRVGFSTCVFKNSLVLFGGVYDKPEENTTTTTTTTTNNNNKKKGATGGAGVGTSEEEPVNAKSIFFNDLYLFDMNKERWSYLSLKNREMKSEGVKQKEPKEEMNKHGMKETTSDFTQNKKVKREEVKSTANSSDIEVDSDEEYYSNVFVYFDEKGNKRTMRVEKEDTEKKEDHQLENEKNEKKDDTNVGIPIPYETIYNKLSSEETLQITKENLQNQTPFVHTEQSILSTLSYNGSDFQIDPVSDEPISEEKHEEMIMRPCETKEETEKEIDQIKHKDFINSDEESKKSEEHKQKFIISDAEPIGRINGQIFIVQKNLYLYGGIYEYKDNEIMLNDFWKINIFKREKWELLDRGNLDDIYVEEPSDSESSDSNLDISEINDETKNEKEIEDLIISNKIKKLEQKLKGEDCGLAFDVKENLNEFFLRTKVHWLKQLSLKAAIRDTKEIRKEAFLLCEKKYNTLKKYYQKIEKYKELLENEVSEDNISDSSSLTDEQSVK